MTEQYKFKLKGVGPIKVLLGCDFFRDQDGVMCFGPKRYIKKMIDSYENMFNEKPKKASSPLEKNDHPELDESDILSIQDQKKYQSMIGALQ